MKRAALTLLSLTLLATSARADKFETLAGFKDSVTIPAGHAAFVLFSTDNPTLQYKKKGRKAVQIRLGVSETASRHRTGYRRPVSNKPSSKQPLALAGPATISLMTDGVISLKLVGPSQSK